MLPFLGRLFSQRNFEQPLGCPSAWQAAKVALPKAIIFHSNPPNPRLRETVPIGSTCGERPPRRAVQGAQAVGPAHPLVRNQVRSAPLELALEV